MNDDQLRALAATRPGYATYPNSNPGSPSWWQRPVAGATGRPVTGRDVARWAREQLDVPIEPWQVRVLDDVLRMPPPAPTATVTTYSPEDPAETERWESQKAPAPPTPTGVMTPAGLANAPAVISRVLGEHLPAIGEALTELVAPPRRRWWHRILHWPGDSRP